MAAGKGLPAAMGVPTRRLNVAVFGVRDEDRHRLTIPMPWTTMRRHVPFRTRHRPVRVPDLDSAYTEWRPKLQFCHRTARRDLEFPHLYRARLAVDRRIGPGSDGD